MYYYGARTKCICVVMFAGAHGAISLVVQCQISVVDSSLSVDRGCYGSPPLSTNATETEKRKLLSQVLTAM